jgi:hypothetical protein
LNLSRSNKQIYTGVMIGVFTKELINASCEAGLCVECPEFAKSLQRVNRLDDEQIADELRSDDDLDRLYDVPPGVNYFLKRAAMAAGGNNLREGRQLTRRTVADNELSHMRKLGQFGSEKPCTGTVLSSGIEPLSLSENAQKTVEGMRLLAEFISQLVNEEVVSPKVHCDLQIRNSTELLLSLDEAAESDS